MLNRDEEFRTAMGKAVFAAVDVARQSQVLKNKTLLDLEDKEWRWIITPAIHAWNEVQRKALEVHQEQFGNILPRLGELPLAWNKPLKDWSREEIVSLLTNAVMLVLKEDPNVPPFLGPRKQPSKNDLSDECPF
jgi:hypothetical protein